jgi:hypothetical protein
MIITYVLTAAILALVVLAYLPKTKNRIRAGNALAVSIVIGMFFWALLAAGVI